MKNPYMQIFTCKNMLSLKRNPETVRTTDITTRKRKFLFWARVRKASLCIAALSSVLVVFGILWSVANIFMGINLGGWEVLLSPTIVVITFAAILLHNAARDNATKYVAQGFRLPNYDLLLKSLSQMGIKRPSLYVEQHPDNIAAFHRVAEICRFKIDIPEGEKLQKLTIFNFWRQKKEWIEEQMVATLVLPGPDELFREERIEDIIIMRGVKTYPEIKALLDQAEELPPALSEGAL